MFNKICYNPIHPMLDTDIFIIIYIWQNIQFIYLFLKQLYISNCIVLK